jgi:hypothetical protein
LVERTDDLLRDHDDRREIDATDDFGREWKAAAAPEATVPSPQVERTRVTRHDEKGRILEFEKRIVPAQTVAAAAVWGDIERRVDAAKAEIKADIAGAVVTKKYVERRIAESAMALVEAWAASNAKLNKEQLQPALNKRATKKEFDALRIEFAMLQARVRTLEGGGHDTDDGQVLDMRGAFRRHHDR